MRVKSFIISVLLSTLLWGGVVGSVGCQSSSGEKTNPFSIFHGKGKNKPTTPPKQKKIEKTGPGTMDEFMSLPRDDSW